MNDTDSTQMDIEDWKEYDKYFDSILDEIVKGFEEMTLWDPSEDSEDLSEEDSGDESLDQLALVSKPPEEGRFIGEFEKGPNEINPYCIDEQIKISGPIKQITFDPKTNQITIAY